MSSFFKYFHLSPSDKRVSAVPSIPLSSVRVPTPTLAIVYQFGKVASTSLVASLNRLDNVEAKQSHFLGYPALSDALRNLSKPDVPDYFFEHQLGQLYENTLLTRRLTAIQTGRSNERLLIVSVAREPFSWFRSVILQDIVGNLERFRNIIGAREARGMSDGTVISIGLHRLLLAFLDIIERHDGIDEIIKKLPGQPAAVFASNTVMAHNDSKLLFYTMLRPFNWFQKHFEPTIGVRVADMDYANSVYRHSTDCADIFILNYEDIAQGLGDSLASLGYGQRMFFEHLNRSAPKPFSKDIEKVFETPEAQKLIPHFADTKYARLHGYAHLGVSGNIRPFR